MITTSEKVLVAREMRFAGMSLATIAGKLHCSITSVARYTSHIKIKPCHPLYRVNQIKHDFFASASLAIHPERMILVGFIAADGCVSRRKASQDTLIVRLGKTDRSVLDVFNQMIAAGTRGISEAQHSFVVSFPSNQLCQDLAAFGIVPRKTAIFRWPSILQGEPARLFLLGYFYGDGCFHRYQNRDVIHFISTRAFAEGLRAFVYQNNIVEHCVLSPLKNRPNYVQSVFQGKHAARLASWLFADVPLPLIPRKHPPTA